MAGCCGGCCGGGCGCDGGLTRLAGAPIVPAPTGIDGGIGGVCGRDVGREEGGGGGGLALLFLFLDCGGGPGWLWLRCGGGAPGGGDSACSLAGVCGCPYKSKTCQRNQILKYTCQSPAFL